MMRLGIVSMLVMSAARAAWQGNTTVAQTGTVASETTEGSSDSELAQMFRAPVERRWSPENQT